MPFNEVLVDESSGNRKVPQSAYLEAGLYPVVDQGKGLIAGYTNGPEYLCRSELPVVVFGDHTKCFKYVDFPFAMGADGIKVLKPRIDANTRFLFYVLRQLRLPDGGYDRHFKYLQRVVIPLPPRPAQDRIAAVLERADSMLEKRTDSIRKLEVLLRAMFLTTFGDPVTNPRRLPTKPLAEFGSVMTGNTPPRSNPVFYGEGIEWIKSDNINTPLHYLTQAEERLSEEGRKVARVVSPGSILVTCIAGSRECIGNVAMTNREVAFNQQINAVTPGAQTNLYFLYTQILLGKRLIQRASTDSMKGMVSKSAFSKIDLLAPSKQDQDSFGEWFEGFNSLHERNLTALRAHEELVRSLQQCAFSDNAVEIHGRARDRDTP